LTQLVLQTSAGVILCGLAVIRGDFDAESSDDYTRRCHGGRVAILVLRHQLNVLQRRAPRRLHLLGQAPSPPERIHEDAVTRRADLLQLEQIACGYPSR
jgi:hypothetical protein